jgi:hypothetical protein
VAKEKKAREIFEIIFGMKQTCPKNKYTTSKPIN